MSTTVNTPLYYITLSPKKANVVISDDFPYQMPHIDIPLKYGELNTIIKRHMSYSYKYAKQLEPEKLPIIYQNMNKNMIKWCFTSKDLIKIELLSEDVQ